MMPAEQARKAARAANDDFIDLKERVSAAVTRACEAGRFEVRIALIDRDLPDVIKELRDHLESLGYSTALLALTDDGPVPYDSAENDGLVRLDTKRILSVRYGADEPRKEDDDAEIQAGAPTR